MKYISLIFQSSFLKMGHSCEIHDVDYKIKKKLPKNHFYFIYCLFCIKDISLLPYKQYIIYQLEQHTNEKINRHYKNFKKEILEKIYKDSFQSFDYCKQNINVIHQELNIIPKLLPIPFSNENNYWNDYKTSEKKYDIVFIGLLNNRRRLILNYLQKFFRIGIPSKNIFGEELVRFILKGKVLLNIHYYDNAILERVRLNEMISIGIPIISEKPNEKDLEICQDYEGIITFIDIINELNQDLVLKLEKYKKEYHEEKINNLQEKFYDSFNKYFNEF